MDSLRYNPPRHNSLQRNYLILVLKGMAMGAADVVPGVSGGTIAFISGIYEELLDSLRRINWQALVLFFQQGPAASWKSINGNFLLALFGGIFISLLSLSHLISYCLTHYPIQVWAFFFGLIIASVIYIGCQLERWTWREWFAFVAGTASALAISMLKPAQLPAAWWTAFLTGAIAICAMILPGISGSFMLLLMGMYSVFINALKTFDILLLLSFGGGCICGLLAFSHLLSWLLKRYHTITLATLTGFLLGSLNVVWPWKQTLLTTVDSQGKKIPLLQENLLPLTYQQLTGVDAKLGWAFLLALLGVVLVLGLERLGTKNRPCSN